MLVRDNEKFRTLPGENRARDPPNAIQIGRSKLDGGEFDLTSGMKISFVPGEHGFSSFQVENVHWKCMCAASLVYH